MNAQQKAKCIEALLEKGESQILLDLLLGESPHSRADQGEFEVSTLEAKKLQAAAVLHLKFLASFGSADSPVKREGRLHFTHTSEFEEWVAIGAPGLPTSDLERYLSAAGFHGNQ